MGYGLRLTGYRLWVTGLCLICAMIGQAQVWRSHLAYNNVTQIAMSEDIVYALSDGSIYGVDKMTEKIYIYDRQTGLHGSDINCIAYDEIGKQLIIGYSTGKIDILKHQRIKEPLRKQPAKSPAFQNQAAMNHIITCTALWYFVYS